MGPKSLVQLPVLDEASRRRESQRVLTKDLIDRYEAEIVGLATYLPATQPRDVLDQEVILLTGGSGSLGTELLTCLCQSPKICKVYALLRGNNLTEKMERAFEARGLSWNSIVATGKIVLLEYSMADYLFGLSTVCYHRLSTEVTTVIHNAWNMNYIVGVEYFEKDYLRGTMHLLKFCAIGRKKSFSFTSTIAAFLAGNTEGFEIDELAGELDIMKCVDTGYALSKFVVESVAQTANQVLQIPVCMFRINQISGDSRSGLWNCDGMGIFPVPLINWIQFVPSDIVARTIHDIITSNSTTSPTTYKIFNISNPNPLPWHRLATMLRNLKVFTEETKEVPTVEWIKMLLARGSVEKKGLGRFFSTGVPQDWKSNLFKTENTAKVSETFRACPEYQEKWLELSVKSWRDQGFLPPAIKSVAKL